LGIYNGVDAAAGAYPFAVMIKNEKTTGSTYRCAGALFAYNLVVTERKLNIGSFYKIKQSFLSNSSFMGTPRKMFNKFLK
jgi:hypothetical protein